MLSFPIHARRGVQQRESPRNGRRGLTLARAHGGHMKLDVFKPKDKQAAFRAARIAFASLASLIVTNDLADAARLRIEQSVVSRPGGEPIMAIVSLHNQQITVYDDKGWIMRAPVSSGQKGRETPAGIFSVLQKDADHYSNMYDDAYMPHMQRLTWSGIALHGGALPGYPASHGCVRMPFAFAAGLFATTQLGMRVIVAPADTAPFEISHPTLFPSQSEASALAAARAVEAAEAAKTADQARLAAVGAAREAAKAMIPVRV